MEEKTFSTRVMQKSDVVSKWNDLETDFIPKKGELVVYLNDDYKTSVYPSRFKIGDGVHKLADLDYSGVTSEELQKAISSSIAGIVASDPAASGDSTTFISSITQTNGAITPKKAYVPTADGSTLGMVYQAPDSNITITNGKITVKDNEHAHTIANITGLQSALDAKATPDAITTRIEGINNAGATCSTSEYISAVSQTAGNIDVSKTFFPIASATQNGFMSTDTQAFSGAKTFNDATLFNGKVCIQNYSQNPCLRWQSIAEAGAAEIWVLGSKSQMLFREYTIANGERNDCYEDYYLPAPTTTSSDYTAYDILTGKNYTSYVPTKTGVGASGTWNIDVSGRAAYLSIAGTNPTTTTTDTYDGFWPGKYTGVYWYNTAGLLNGQPSQSGLLLDVANNTEHHQLYMVQTDGAIFHRGMNGLRMGSWKEMLDNSNYTNYVPTKTGSGASGTWGISISGAASKIAVTETTPPASQTQYKLLASDGTGASKNVLAVNGIFYQANSGTTSAEGSASIVLGNSKSAGTADNLTGEVILFNKLGKYTALASNPSCSLTGLAVKLPNRHSTLATTWNNDTDYNYRFGGAQETGWRTIVKVHGPTTAPTTTTYHGLSIVGSLYSEGGNHYQCEVTEYPFQFYTQFLSNLSITDKPYFAIKVLGASVPQIRAVKISTNTYEIQVRQKRDWEYMRVRFTVSSNSSSYYTVYDPNDLQTANDGTVLEYKYLGDDNARTISNIDGTLKVFPSDSNSIRFGGAGTSTTIYMGAVGADNRSAITNFVFGSSGAAQLSAKGILFDNLTGAKYINASNYTGNAATATKATRLGVISHSLTTETDTCDGYWANTKYSGIYPITSTDMIKDQAGKYAILADFYGYGNDRFQLLSYQISGPMYYRKMSGSTQTDWIQILDSTNYSDLVVKKSGDTMTGNLHWSCSGQNTITSPNSNTDVGFKVKNSNGVYAALQVGSGGINHGVWATGVNSWLIYADADKAYIPNWASIGSATTPIYFTSAGRPASCNTSSMTVGAANKVNNALTIKANGTTLATFDGSSASSVNITYSNVGAAAASHTHSYIPLSGGEVTGKIYSSYAPPVGDLAFRNIKATTDAVTAGSTSLATGTILVRYV